MWEGDREGGTRSPFPLGEWRGAQALKEPWFFGVDEYKAFSGLPGPLQGELESSGGRESGLLSVLPTHKSWGYGVKSLFLPEILGRAWPFLSSGFSPLYHLLREFFLLAQSTVTASLKYDLSSLDLIQFHLQSFFFFLSSSWFLSLSAWDVLPSSGAEPS